MSFKRICPKSIVLPSLITTIYYKNTRKRSTSSVLIENESDLDKARKVFEEKYAIHDKESIDKISLDMCQYRSAFVGIEGIDFDDKEELDDIFFTFKVEYEDLLNPVDDQE